MIYIPVKINSLSVSIEYVDTGTDKWTNETQESAQKKTHTIIAARYMTYKALEFSWKMTD